MQNLCKRQVGLWTYYFLFLLNGKKNKNWCLYNRRELFSWQSARVTPPSWIRLAWISVFPRVKSSHKPCCPTSHLGATLFCKLLWMIYTHCTRIFFLANLKHKLSKYLFYFIDIQLIITYLEKKINHNISGKKFIMTYKKSGSIMAVNFTQWGIFFSCTLELFYQHCLHNPIKWGGLTTHTRFRWWVLLRILSKPNHRFSVWFRLKKKFIIP